MFPWTARRDLVLLAALCKATGCGGGDGPAAPSPTTVSLTIVVPTSGPIFIGSTTQFQVQETLSDGTTGPPTFATWGSDNQAVATVSSTGLVTAVAAGEATIFADAGPRATRLVRVLPNFGGTWAGNEVLIGCTDSGSFAGFCDDVQELIGAAGLHRSAFVQDGAAVNADLDGGDGTHVNTTGTISIGGDLQLLPASLLPADPVLNVQAQNWRSRSDVPSRMTGSYELLLTAPGISGSVTVRLELRDVVRASSPASAVGTGLVSGASMSLVEGLRLRMALRREP